MIRVEFQNFRRFTEEFYDNDDGEIIEKSNSIIYKLKMRSLKMLSIFIFLRTVIFRSPLISFDAKCKQRVLSLENFAV